MGRRAVYEGVVIGQVWTHKKDPEDVREIKNIYRRTRCVLVNRVNEPNEHKPGQCMIGVMHIRDLKSMYTPDTIYV